MIVRTTDEIINNPWGEIDKEDTFYPRTPFKWFKDAPLTFEDIVLWEEIYYQPGIIGVYASWDPYEDYYIIVHNLHLDKMYIEHYVGVDAVDSILNRCKEFGVDLKVAEFFVSED